MPTTSLVLTGARLLTCDGPPGAPLGLLDRAAVVCTAGRITWLGPETALPASGADLPGGERLDAGGRLVSPGLVDCHTHLVFAGDRASEFALRARGASYQEIAASGGGIAATLGPTRAAASEELVALTAARAGRAVAAGTTTLEAKTGYDLTVAGELRLLEVIAAAGARTPARLVPTLLAHVVPPEHRGSAAARAGYVDALCGELIPVAADRRLATSVDVYCDEGAFTLDETSRILSAARTHGLARRAHVGQFADLGGAELLADLGALSADHLERISDAGIAALARAGVVAVMLPTACVQLRLAPPPVERLRAAGVPFAVATDLNPGTSLCETLAIPMWLAATHYGLTVEETWLGVTRNAARALGRTDVGALRPGALADLVVWETDDAADIPYRIGANLVHTVFVNGRRAA